MRDACIRAEIPHRAFHALRHTHATVLLSAGVNPKVVQERLGHADIKMTLGTYGHVMPTMQQAVVKVLEGW
jgi:integrase